MTRDASSSGRHDAAPAFSTLGRRPYAHQKSSAIYSFGKEQLTERFGSNLGWGEPSPGPGTYAWGPSVAHTSGCIVPSSHTKWGTDPSKRSFLGLPPHPHTLPPGPGLYLRSKGSFHLTGTPQQLGGWRNAASAGFQGYCTRECRTPLVLSHEHERERYGTHSPGPMTAAPVDSVGRQLMSTRKTQPRCSFSRAGRFSDAAVRVTDAVPGPGAYSF